MQRLHERLSELGQAHLEECQRLEARIVSEAENARQLAREVHTLRASNEALEEDLQNRHSELAESTAQLDQLLLQRDQLLLQLEDSRQQGQQLEASRELHEQERSHWRESLERVQAELDASRAQVVEQLQLIEEGSSELERRGRSIEELQARVARLESQKRATLSQYEILRQQAGENDAAVAALEREVESGRTREALHLAHLEQVMERVSRSEQSEAELLAQLAALEGRWRALGELWLEAEERAHWAARKGTNAG